MFLLFLRLLRLLRLSRLKGFVFIRVYLRSSVDSLVLSFNIHFFCGKKSWQKRTLRPFLLSNSKRDLC